MSEKFVMGHDKNIGKGEHSNMPKDVYMRAYPKGAGMKGAEIDDSIKGIDESQAQAERKRKSNLSNQK